MAFIHPQKGQAEQYFMNPPAGPIVMMNLLRFRKTADYSKQPNLALDVPTTGKKAYEKYMLHTLPLLKKAGSEVVFFGDARAFLIGPQEEKWDAALLVKHASAQSFMAFAADKTYLMTSGHRDAALADSRLLPLDEKSL